VKPSSPPSTGDPEVLLPFLDRQEAGIELARLLLREIHLQGSLSGPAPRDHAPTRVIGLARGGVPLAREVAFRLKLPLDFLLVRKIGAPGNPELALGALAEGGEVGREEALIRLLGITPEGFERARKSARQKLMELERRHRSCLALGSLAGENVLLVDDGLATGATARTAAEALRKRGAERVELAIPVASREGLDGTARFFDRIHVLAVPSDFLSVGSHYRNFESVDDDTVEQLCRDTWVRLTDPAVTLPVHLLLPETPSARGALPFLGMVLFSPGLGSGPESPRNRRIAERLAEVGIGSLIPGLQTEAEARLPRSEDASEISAQAARLLGLLQWLRNRAPEGLSPLPIGMIGSSFGAAAAALVAADPQAWIDTLVFRGGRLDLALHKLRAIQCPTLLLVGEKDPEILEINQQARARLPWGTLALIPGASHLFEEPGTLEEAAHQIAGWFRDHLSRALTLAA
jgi:putative phosphoribosyl transferase